jgi:hypothetical protein
MNKKENRKLEERTAKNNLQNEMTKMTKSRLELTGNTFVN